MIEIERLPDDTDLLYAQLLQQCKKSAPSGNGLSFVKKTIKGRVYWYLQARIGNRQTQRYVGPDTFESQEKIKLEKQLWKNAEAEIAKRQELVAMLQAKRAFIVNNNEARVFAVMERCGIFLAGGVLVGSQAFDLYQNMLGIRWVKSLPVKAGDFNQTSDVCFEIGILNNKNINVKEKIIESGLGIFEISALHRKTPSTSFRFREQEFKVVLQTPMIAEEESPEPVVLKFINASATPVRFLDFLLSDVQAAVVIVKSGILVNVASPARYALYKLVVSQHEDSKNNLTLKTDIEQAGQLLAVLLKDKPGDISLAIKAAKSRQDQFYSLLLSGIKQLPTRLQDRLNDEILTTPTTTSLPLVIPQQIYQYKAI